MPEDAKTEGHSASGGTQGQPQQEASKYVTAEDVQRIIGTALKTQRNEFGAWLSGVLKEEDEEIGDGEAGEAETGGIQPPPEAKTDAEKRLLAQLQREQRERAKLARRMEKLEAHALAKEKQAEERERQAAIRSELAGLSVTKTDAAFKIIRDDIYRGEDGKLYAKNAEGDEVPLKEYVAGWLKGFPEFQPPRTAGGTGATGGSRQDSSAAGTVTLEDIRPGMKPEEKQRVYRRIAELAAR